MQPQGPYGQGGSQPPYTPGQAIQPQGPYPPQPNGVVQPYPQQVAPGQQFQAGPPMQPYPSGPIAPNPQQPLQPQIPGRPAMPAYQVPQSRRGQAGLNDNLPPPPEAPTTPYDFFMQPKPHQDSMPLPVTGRRITNTSIKTNDGAKNKFAFVVAGAIGVIIIIVLAALLIPKDQTGPQLISLAQTEQEVIRVCNQGSSAKFQSTRDFAATCSASVATNQTELLAYLKKQNFAFKPKELNLKANTKTDATLKAAQSSSTFDKTFREVTKGELVKYNRGLENQLSVTTGVNARAILTKSQQSVLLLSKMVADDSNQTVAPADGGSATN